MTDLELLVFSGDDVQTFALPKTGMVTIGRGEQSGLRIDDPSVSRNHAILRVSDGLEVEDLRKRKRDAGARADQRGIFRERDLERPPSAEAGRPALGGRQHHLRDDQRGRAPQTEDGGAGSRRRQPGCHRPRSGDARALRAGGARGASHSTCSSSARPASARRCSPRAIHRTRRARERPVPAAQLRGAAGVAARERAVRAREGRVHRRRSSRKPGLLRGGGRRHRVPRRDRRAAARRRRPSCCACSRSARCTRVGSDARRDRSTCASSPRPTAISRRRSQPGAFRAGPVLPPQRRSTLADPAAARAAARRSSRSRSCSWPPPSRERRAAPRPRSRREALALARRPPLARQRARAAQRDRARRRALHAATRCCPSTCRRRCSRPWKVKDRQGRGMPSRRWPFRCRCSRRAAASAPCSGDRRARKDADPGRARPLRRKPEPRRAHARHLARQADRTPRLLRNHPPAQERRPVRAVASRYSPCASRRAAPASRAAVRSRTRRPPISAPSPERHFRLRVLPFETRSRELGVGDAAARDLEPDHERAALAPARAAPAAVARHERALLAARAGERGGAWLRRRFGRRLGARRFRARGFGEARRGWCRRRGARRAAPRRGVAAARTTPAPPRIAVTTSLDVARDVGHERGARLLAARDAREPRLPGPGQLGRGQARHRQRVDEPDAHVGRARGSSRRARRTSRRSSVSMVAARVAGVPRPESLIAARSASSSMSRPADSIAPSSVASVWRGGGRVCLVDASKRRPAAGPRRAAAASVVAVAVAVARSRRRLAELRDRLPAGDQPHPPAREVAIGRRRQRRHERLVARRSPRRRRAARRPRAARLGRRPRGSRPRSARTRRRGGTRPRKRRATRSKIRRSSRGSVVEVARACPSG